MATLFIIHLKNGFILKVNFGKSEFGAVSLQTSTGIKRKGNRLRTMKTLLLYPKILTTLELKRW
jgi:hypothetical protein